MSTDELMNDIKNALKELITLKIVTAVGPIQLDGAGNPKATCDISTRLILTEINLLQGDITTKISPEFVTGEYQNLRDFHMSRVSEAQDIVQKNIAAIKSMVELITNIKNVEET
jgi:hypothetical protein